MYICQVQDKKKVTKYCVIKYMTILNNNKKDLCSLQMHNNTNINKFKINPKNCEAPPGGFQLLAVVYIHVMLQSRELVQERQHALFNAHYGRARFIIKSAFGMMKAC